MGPLVLDTNVLAYAVGDDHPFRGPCRELVDAIGDGRPSATTTVEVLQEFAYVHGRRRTRSDATSRALRYAALLAPLFPLTAEHLAAGVLLWQRHDALSSLDAILAASCINTGATLVSADKAFTRVRDLDHVVPDARGVKRLIAG